MVTWLHLGVVLAGLSTAFASPKAISVACNEDAVNITWRIRPELVPHAMRFFLGNCNHKGHFDLPSGVKELQFYYNFNECKFKPQYKGKHIIFENELAFRPQQKGNPAAFVYPIQCIVKRSDGWAPPFLNPGAGSSEAHGGLRFQLALLNAELTDISQSNLVPQGSALPIWAAVEQQAHQPLLLHMEECVVATTRELGASSEVYPLVTNKGCLIESVRGNAVFLPRHQSSSLILYIHSFGFGFGKEVYIHCKLVAWDPDDIDKTKKACQYLAETQRWELLDRPERSSICNCCASNCKAKQKRHTHIESEGLRSVSVLGPLEMVEANPPAQDAKTGPLAISAHLKKSNDFINAAV